MKTAVKDFKMTELGPIPKDWEVKRLGDVAPLQRGFDLPTAELEDGPCPVVYSNGIGNYHCKAMCDAPGLVTGRSGTIGHFTYIAEGRYWPHNTALWVTSFNGNHPLFVKYLYETLGFENFSTGTGVPTLNRNIVHDYLIPLPPLPEQRKIAAALSDVDEMIAALEKLIEKKRKIKTGAMQRLLTGKTRLPGFKDAWVEKRLGELSDIMTGATPSTNVAAYWGGDIRWMSSGEVHLKYVKDVVGRITRQGFDSASTCMLPAKTVLIALAGQGKTRGTVAISLIPLCTNQSIAGIVPSSLFNSDFLYHCLDARYEDLRMISSGDGSRGGLSKQILSDYVVNIPPTLAEQKAIAKVLGDMDEEIAALEAELAKTRQLKQGMMQELLTGETRLGSQIV